MRQHVERKTVQFDSNRLNWSADLIAVSFMEINGGLGDDALFTAVVDVSEALRMNEISANPAVNLETGRIAVLIAQVGIDCELDDLFLVASV